MQLTAYISIIILDWANFQELHKSIQNINAELSTKDETKPEISSVITTLFSFLYPYNRLLGNKQINNILRQHKK